MEISGLALCAWVLSYATVSGKRRHRFAWLRVIADKVYENSKEVIVSTAGQQVIFEYKGMSFSTHPRDMLYGLLPEGTRF